MINIKDLFEYFGHAVFFYYNFKKNSSYNGRLLKLENYSKRGNNDLLHKITFIIGELHCQCPLIYRKFQVCSNINYFDIAIIKAADLSNDKLQTETLNLSKHLQRSFPHGAKLLLPSYVLPRESPCAKKFNLKDIRML